MVLGPACDGSSVMGFCDGKDGDRERPRCHPEALREAEVAWFWLVIGGTVAFLKLPMLLRR